MIRKAESKDTKKIMELLSQVLTVHHNGRPDIFKGGATKYTEHELLSILGDPLRPVFVYEKDRALLGYAFCIFQREENSNILQDIKTLYIDDLCVDEGARGQRIGTALYNYVLEFARAEGCYNVTLNVWALNEGALAFYRSLGMSPLKYSMEQIL